jgi:hypothetical protein
MSRPGIEFRDELKIVIGVDLVRRQDAVLTVYRKDGDRDHKVAGKLEGVGLDEGKIVGHGEELHPGTGQFPLDGTSKGPGTVTITASGKAKRPQLARGPPAG